MVGKSCDFLVVLKTPAIEMIAGDIFKISVKGSRRIVRQMRSAVAMDDKESIFDEDTFKVISISRTTHHDRNEVEMILFRGIGERGGFFRGNIVGKRDAVVSGGCSAREAGDHAIDFFGVGHVSPDKKPAFLKRRRAGIS